MHLLDTSPKMLARARARLAARPVRLESSEGVLDQRFADHSFDVILTCSVLHHVPDLVQLLDQVARVQTPGGVFLHLQDPNADAVAAPAAVKRRDELTATKSRVPKAIRRLAPRRVAAALARRLGVAQEESYIERTNCALVAGGHIARPMAPHDIWTITDIHVNNGNGIALAQLRSLLPAYDLLSHRTYAFFGELMSNLPPGFRPREAMLIDQRDGTGAYLAAAWRRCVE